MRKRSTVKRIRVTKAQLQAQVAAADKRLAAAEDHVKRANAQFAESVSKATHEGILAHLKKAEQERVNAQTQTLQCQRELREVLGKLQRAEGELAWIHRHAVARALGVPETYKGEGLSNGETVTLPPHKITIA